MRIQIRSRVAVLLLAVALASACSTTQLKVATDVAKVSQSALIATRLADQALYDQGLITVGKHREHQQALYRAFDLHQQGVRITLLIADGKTTAPDGTPLKPEQFAAKVQEAWLILQAVIADLPKGPGKDKAAALAAKGIF